MSPIRAGRISRAPGGLADRRHVNRCGNRGRETSLRPVQRQTRRPGRRALTRNAGLRLLRPASRQSVAIRDPEYEFAAAPQERLSQGLRIVASAAGLQIVAKVRTPAPEPRLLLRHALVTRAGEAEWTHDFELPGLGQETAPVVDACGVLHMLVLPELPGFRSEVWHLRWDDGWREPTTLESGYLSAGATRAASPDGDVWAAWLRTRDTESRPCHSRRSSRV